MGEAEAQLLLFTKTSYAENVIDVGKVTFGLDENQRNKCPQAKTWEENKKEQSEKSNKDLVKDLNKKREDQINNLTRAACALLNSGGGVIRAEIENEKYSRKENGIGTKIENSFRRLIQDRISSDFFEFKHRDSEMMIFVKTWSSENSAFPRLCSLNTGLYARSESCAVEVKPRNVVDHIRKKKDAAQRGSVEDGRPEAKRACLSDDQDTSSQDSLEGEEDVRRAAAKFFRRDKLQFEEILDFAESNTVEFKAFPRDEDSLAFVNRMLPRYASAFANTEGGYLIFGVENSRKVIGCRSCVDPIELEEAVGAIIKSLPRFHFCTSEENVIFEFKALPVQDEDGDSRGYVFAVSFDPFSGVVFQSVPDSWIVEADFVKRLTVLRWIELMTAEDPDLSNLADHFTRVLSLSDGPPLVKPVYSVSDLNSLQESLFPATSQRIGFIPESLCNQLFRDYPGLRDLMESKIQPPVQGMLMFSRSWAVDIGLPKNQDIVCDAVLIAAGSHVLLFTIAKAPEADVCEHSRRTAKQLKHKLVNVGGFSQKICVISRILCLSGDAIPENGCVQYPSTYSLQKPHLSALQKSVVIVLLNFKSFLSDFLGVHFLNLLTIKQYENLSKNLRKTPHQFIYGLPGSGKTVVALEILEKIRNEFNCDPSEVLYICENKPLQDFVRRRTNVEAVTRATFMSGHKSFQHVKHIVVDEAQNFRKEHGLWYKKAKNIVKRGGAPGILWIFLDYFQMSHPFDTGLPPLKHQYPQEQLSTVVRNATSIYKMMKLEMERIVENKELRIPHQVLRKLLEESKCGHAREGGVKIQYMSEQEIANYVIRECRQYLEKGYSRKDIAILCSTQEDSKHFESFLAPELRKFHLDLNFVKADEIHKDKIVLDSIRRFSGLERPIVFGINPVSTQTEVVHNLLLCLVSRANLHLHVLYTKARENQGGPYWSCTM